MGESDRLAAGSVSGGRVATRELRTSGQSRGQLVSGDQLELQPGGKLTAGRQGQLLLGADPIDLGVSRQALTVRLATEGWEIECANRVGATIYPWARQPEFVAQGVRRVVRWPRVSLLVGGLDEDAQHWVLLEADDFEIGGLVVGRDVSADTSSVMETLAPSRPTDITRLQLDAVRVIFADHLAWPPVANPVARSLDSARHRLEVGSESAVKARLQPVRDRAYALGLTRQVGLTDPAYIYHLAELGFFAAPRAYSQDGE